MLLGVNNFVYEQKWLNVFMIFILRVEKNFMQMLLNLLSWFIRAQMPIE
jgi:hypothetical protein